MKIAIIGASGFVGSRLLKEALDRSHHVTALARQAAKITATSPHLAVKELDIFDSAPFVEALKGHDIVISAYNPGWTHPDLYNEFIRGSRTIQDAVKEAGVPRLIVIGGAGSLEIAPGIQLVDTPEFPSQWKTGATAARDYLDLIKKETGIDWTFVSPAIEMHAGTSGVRTGNYRIGGDQPVFDEQNRSIISAEDLAVAVLDEAEKKRFPQQRFTVAY